MANMIVLEEFKQRGGTELAPMSTSASKVQSPHDLRTTSICPAHVHASDLPRVRMPKATAFSYAQSKVPLVFKFVVKGMTRGVSIDFLSVYPGEAEFLYAPLTYICYKGESKDGDTTVISVEPQQA